MFALETHKQYDLLHSKYLQIVKHVDTIEKVLVDELGQLIKHGIVNKVDAYYVTQTYMDGHQLSIMNLGHKFYLEFWEGGGHELAKKKGNEIFWECKNSKEIIDTEDNNNNIINK